MYFFFCKSVQKIKNKTFCTSSLYPNQRGNEVSTFEIIADWEILQLPLSGIKRRAKEREGLRKGANEFLRVHFRKEKWNEAKI